jgi:cellulose synthase/poly-beta-1,6-N-acetylglucosamine synthase-like glycosyltransferase
LTQHQGKASALNVGAGVADGEIICFTDARQLIAPDALKMLVSNFADPRVGCVSGELVLQGRDDARTDGVRLYWSLEKKIREWESAAGSVVGATGALYAARRRLVESIPSGTILDDVLIPLTIARRGYRVVFEPRAIVWDSFQGSSGQELRRKIRTLTGNYQLPRQQPWLLTLDNPILFEFVSHKLLRLFVPFLLITLLLSGTVLSGWVYRIATLFQLMFYSSSLFAFFRFKVRSFGKLPEAALAFLLLNAAAFIALIYVVTGRKKVWVR